MENHELDKYVEYVLAQVGEGRHTKEDIKIDLHERGLSDAEVKEVLDVAWEIGTEFENGTRGSSLKSIVIILCFYVFMCLILYLTGHSIIEFCSFGAVIGGIIALIRLFLRKRKFR